MAKLGIVRRIKTGMGANTMKQLFFCWKNSFVSLLTLVILGVGLPVFADALTVTIDPLETNTATPTLAGTVSPGAAAVNIRIGQENHNAAISGTSWSLVWPTALEPGTYDVKSTATDGTNFSYDNTSNELVIK